MAANLDLYATFAALTGGDEPKDKPGYISMDLSQTLLQGAASPRHQWLYGPHAYRSGNYKIHLATKDRSSDPDTRQKEPMVRHDPPLLFDLKSDLGEQSNIADQRPEVVDRLVKEMRQFPPSRS